MTPSRSLRILQVGTCFHGWGGAELHLINLSEQLTLRGHDVTVACQPGKFVEAEARRRSLPTFGAVVANQQDWSSAGVLSRLMRSTRFDVVHVHWAGDYVVPPAIARLQRVPAVLMSRHSPYPLKSAMSRFLYGKVLYDRIIALSDSVRTTLLSQGLSSERIITIHHGTDTEAFREITADRASVRSEWGMTDADFVVGAAGRLAQEKGLLHLVDALDACPPLVRCVLIGDGPQRHELQARVTTLGLTDRVTFAGFRSDVNNAINAVDVLVQASTWAEPCAAVVQQAMCLSRPVIGTNTGGTPEMVADAETGILVPPGDPAALAAAITRLSGDRDLCKSWGIAGCARAERLFTLRGMTDHIEGLYNQLIEARVS